jgi:FkbM family methyltransferase
MWRKAYQAGYSIRRNEENAFPDQVSLLKNVNVQTIFDLGANVGDVAVEYRKLFPQARVYAFEPLPDLLEILNNKVCGDNHILVQAVAVADTVGTATFHVNAKSDTSSLLGTDLSQVPDSYRNVQRTERVIEVPIVTLDRFCEEHSIEQVDLLKLDIQGAEYSALRGASRLLAEQRIGIIYTETFLLPFYKDQPLLGDICKLLGQYGYQIHNFYNLSFSGGSGRCTWMDAIFVSPKFLEISKELLIANVKS